MSCLGKVRIHGPKGCHTVSLRVMLFPPLPACSLISSKIMLIRVSRVGYSGGFVFFYSFVIPFLLCYLPVHHPENLNCKI